MGTVNVGLIAAWTKIIWHYMHSGTQKHLEVTPNIYFKIMYFLLCLRFTHDSTWTVIEPVIHC